MSKRHILIDCDPGADDALALMLALHSPELAVHGITTVAGNRGVHTCTENALRILEHYGRTDIPVAQGEEQPLEKPLCMDDIYSGKDGMAEVFLPYRGAEPVVGHGVDMLLHWIRECPRKMTIVSIAPMTNLARMLQREPGIVEKIDSIVTINGSYGVYRDLHRFDSRLEWNVFVDPHAAKLVLESGVPIHALGIDVTGQLTNQLYERLLQARGADPMPHRFLEDAGRFLRSRKLEPLGLFVDAMAVAYAVDPAIAHTVAGKVMVETEGALAGLTLFDNVGNIKNASDVRAAYQFDWERFAGLLEKRVLA